jgi:AcrR family transcriptional regulator
MAAVEVETLGLRERKKQRTRQTIVDVGVRLFAAQGYSETTLVEIAAAAEIAPSTFFNYFPAKVDIVFGLLDAAIEGARERLLERPLEETAVEAVLSWVADDLPVIEAPYSEALRLTPQIIAAVPELQAEQRLREAVLEDVFAEAFARDLGESADGLHAHVMGTVALRGMLDFWHAWYERHVGDAVFDPSEVFAGKAAYLEEVLHAGMALIRSLPVTADQ